MTARRSAIAAVAVAIVLATVLSPFASSAPDGLERVAADRGFAGRAVAREAPAADYALPGVADPRLGTALAGLAGTLAVLAAGALAGRVVVRRRP